MHPDSITKNRIKLVSGITVLVLGMLSWAGIRSDGSAATDSGPSFVGSVACKACHTKVYDPIAASPHGKLFTEESLSPEIKGCESCHGPGSIHVGSAGKTRLSIPKAENPAAVNKTCGACHFKSESSKAPKEWQNLSSSNWVRTMHGRRNLSCLSCHTGHPDANNKTLIKPVTEICLDCHVSLLEDAPGKKSAYTHSPVATGKCIMCHDPHGNAGTSMMVKDMKSVCEKCHKTDDPKLVTAHSNYPIAGSQCNSCHDPHSHDHKGKLIGAKRHMPFKPGQCQTCHTKPVAGKPIGLVKPSNDLCFSCHPASTLMPAGENAHVPAKQGLCIECHSPHATRETKLLKARQATLCFSCHSKVEDSTVKEYKHVVLDTNMNCTMCHKPHSSTQESLIVKDEMSLCGQCHKHSGSHPMGGKSDGTKVTDPNTKKTLTCRSCHDNHGSSFDTLMLADKKRDLCLKCHNPEH
ncbi:MAG: cytochrome c3 family protein [Armatimonadota bacterium]